MAQSVVSVLPALHEEPDLYPLFAELPRDFALWILVHEGGPFRTMRCSMWGAPHMGEKAFGWPVEMLVKAAWAGYRTLELPIHSRHRRLDRLKVPGALVRSVKAAYFMLSSTVRYAGARRRDV